MCEEGGGRVAWVVVPFETAAQLIMQGVTKVCVRHNPPLEKVFAAILDGRVIIGGGRGGIPSERQKHLRSWK